MDKQEIFKVGSQIFIWTDKFEIGGIHNYESEKSMIENFGVVINFDRCFRNSIKGTIKMVGKHNMYVIESFDGKNYIYCNDYNEMWEVM